MILLLKIQKHINIKVTNTKTSCSSDKM